MEFPQRSAIVNDVLENMIAYDSIEGAVSEWQSSHVDPTHNVGGA
jgi:hypothetical protein